MFSNSSLVCGDALAVMPRIDNDTYDAIITDPPYASGGISTAARAQDPRVKYQQTGTLKYYPTFANDNRDQRTHLMWSVRWMDESLRLTRPGGWLMVFTDWRQLPLTSDALQISGWTWRAIITWDKTEACRPRPGMFRNQAEFVLVATRGDLPKEQDRPRVFPAGVWREYLRPGDKLHMTAKPINLMSHLMSVLSPASSVLDPFAGSGTTLLAARRLGHIGHGIELSPDYVRIARDRLAASAN